MGMGKRNIVNMLIIEQAIITGTAVLLGIFAGELASLLYVPMIQLSIEIMLGHSL